MQRREFIKTGVATAVFAPYIGSADFGKQKVRMGFIGVGSRGTQVMRLFQAQPDVEVAAFTA